MSEKKSNIMEGEGVFGLTVEGMQSVMVGKVEGMVTARQWITLRSQLGSREN